MESEDKMWLARIAWLAIVIWMALVAARPAPARIIETILDVAVRVKTEAGQVVEQPIKVTVLHDTVRVSSPYLILNHGRPYEDAKREQMRRMAFPPISHYFVERGFVVIVPTRIGYGYSGGPDVESSGECARRNYPPAYAAAADESAAVLQYAKRLSYVDQNRGVVVGQSFGGTTAITLAARGLPGLVGAINLPAAVAGTPRPIPSAPAVRTSSRSSSAIMVRPRTCRRCGSTARTTATSATRFPGSGSTASLPRAAAAASSGCRRTRTMAT
jgi:pimeloyl-ACP methyl ester carboxylesterase